MRLRRIVLARHGETEGQSSVRFHGSSDVDLSPEGRAQMERLGVALGDEPLDAIVASPLRRSWRAAAIVRPGAQVTIEHDFREIDFGRWEGLTAEEIKARDPVLYEDWQGGSTDFAFPEGESRAHFRERVGHGLDRLLARPGRFALAVLHKGVIREITRRLLGELPDVLGPEGPAIGGWLDLGWRPTPAKADPEEGGAKPGTDGSWSLGRRPSSARASVLAPVEVGG